MAQRRLDLTNKDVLVVGIKRSGLGAVSLLRNQGANVRLMDAQPQEPGILSQSPENLGHPDLIVLSPGVPIETPLFAEAQLSGIPVIGEVELASYFLKGPTIGITGSNGKTTVTALTGHLLSECGIACQVGGNIGTAVTSLIDSSRDDQWNVFELSSFQLESIANFEARIAACLNVTPDHLDRHHTFDNYAAAKARLFETQTSLDQAVLNYDDATCRRYAHLTKGEVYWFSSTQPVPQGLASETNQLLYCGEPFAACEQIKLRGRHNVENVMAAVLVAHLAGAPLDDLGKALAIFPGVEHRLEFLRTLHGVDYFNDSKATNVDATLKAISAFPKNLWIILGGKDKGSDYSPLRQPLAESARAVLLIGAATPLIKDALQEAVELIDCQTLENAVSYAHAHARAGDTVLLAPACASFDQFQNYEERGKTFKQEVAKLF